MKKLLSIICSLSILGIMAFSTPYVSAADTQRYTYSVLEDGTISIESYKHDYTIKDLYIPASIDGYTVSTIGYCAFAHIDIPGIVHIPDTVHTIEVGAFYQALMSGVRLPAGLKKIGSEAFFACREMTYIVVPSSVTAIGDCALGYYYFPDLDNPTVVPGDVGINPAFTMYITDDSCARSYAQNNAVACANINTLIAGDYSLDNVFNTSNIRLMLQSMAVAYCGYAQWCDADHNGIIDTTDVRYYLATV